MPGRLPMPGDRCPGDCRCPAGYRCRVGSDARPVIDAGAIAYARPVIDARAISDARPVIDAGSIADAGLSPRPVDCRCRADRRSGGDSPDQVRREVSRDGRRQRRLPVDRHHPKAGWEVSQGARPLHQPERAAEPVWGCLPLGYERSPPPPRDIPPPPRGIPPPPPPPRKPPPPPPRRGSRLRHRRDRLPRALHAGRGLAECTKASAKLGSQEPSDWSGYHRSSPGVSGADVSDERITADCRGSLAGERSRADQVELIGARHGLAADRSLQRLPEDPVLAERRERVRG